ncbi:hypothetical protein [Nonomuraea jiangxiensis]|uniref:Copper(I)-binding protein n=1 Tax=Nonomuraea jiangxiensis TaxID=633440 RepID=A0A1G9KJJ2_9ACTN|nr:hypothetical protein [Nonomuraea jiangxiensis]SDL49958.1 hypothetical protein SAMN05421869_126138 [Nonomuraea jiangxiensis]
MRRIVLTAFMSAVAVTGCSQAGLDTTQTEPQNDGANADLDGELYLRNVFLVGGAETGSPGPQQVLYGVLINSGDRPVRLERVTVGGGGSVQLAGALTLPPDQPVGVDDQPLGTVSGVRGDTVPMTFFFSGAEPVQLEVPVKARVGQYASLTPVPSGSPPATPTPGGPPSATTGETAPPPIMPVSTPPTTPR